MKRSVKIPGEKEWRGYKNDLDVRHAHKLLFGKSIPEVLKYFEGARSIERSSELLFMPRGAFQYYVLAFVEFIKSKEAAGDSDGASSFIRLLINREKKDVGSVSSIYPLLKDAVDLVAEGQKYFDAPLDIYGSFFDLRAELIQLLERSG